MSFLTGKKKTFLNDCELSVAFVVVAIIEFAQYGTVMYNLYVFLIKSNIISLN